MYNRYIPRPDGSYSCSRVSEPRMNRQSQKASSPPLRNDHEEPMPRPCKEKKTSEQADAHPISFLRQLFGQDFDTGDLVVILLLLLMAGDSEEDRSNALLTIALYFLM